MRALTRNINPLLRIPKYNFSGFGTLSNNIAGPYNPYLYKDYLVPKQYPRVTLSQNLISTQVGVSVRPFT